MAEVIKPRTEVETIKYQVEHKLISEKNGILEYEGGYWCRRPTLDAFESNPEIYLWRINPATKEGRLVFLPK